MWKFGEAKSQGQCWSDGQQIIMHVELGRGSNGWSFPAVLISAAGDPLLSGMWKDLRTDPSTNMNILVDFLICLEMNVGVPF